MINPAEIPQIPGDLDVLATHAQTIRTTGGDFASTGQAVDSTWQGLAAVYEAPEAAQLFAATGPVRTVSASVGEDIQAVGTALSTYATEVKQIKAQLAALKLQAEQFVASTNEDDDWREDESKVDRHNGLISAVNTQVAAFFEAQRTCANTINALYGGRQYRADNADGRADDGEYGFTADTLDAAAGEDGALPWGSNEEHDRGFWGDVGAYFGGIGESFVTMLEDLGGLIGRDPVTGEWSWGTAGQSWLGLGKFVWAVAVYTNPVTAVIDQTTGMPFMGRREAGNLLLNAGKSIIAYDTWGEDKSKAAGMTTFNIVSAVVGTKGAGSGLRGAGAAVNGIRGSATAARIGAALVRTGNWLDNLPTVGDVALNVAGKFDIKIPNLGLVPAIAGDVPIGRGFEVEMPNGRPGHQMNMDSGDGNGPQLPRDDPPVSRPPTHTGVGDGPVGDRTPVDSDPVDSDPRDDNPGDPPEDDNPGDRPGDDNPSYRDPDSTPGDDTPEASAPGDEAADGSDANTADTDSSGPPEWLQNVREGNEFNHRREPFYTEQGGANEVHVEPKSDKGQYPRVDSYVPGREIVSRKFTQLAEIKPETAIEYLREFDRKYKEGTIIADTPTNRRDLGDDLVGKELEGEMILEVPVQDADIPPEVLKEAENLGITIRDEEGNVYELPDDEYREGGDDVPGDHDGE
ncbi:hypothetical protein [Micromonospora yangpuensis]|uniref:Uncharacterized protein n=1 Tax=Micromonospora yangpuensis TaxID=683228 RepID=A0A1C6U2I8_9ACTN|nr:hypothetical protein [Micromonospora yangpuensis]GGM10417.1 hypothetical protein GCM10012279_30590 [Micromonospora yangpuensis]SCL48128.1 hypothetical protein GA0070617_0784 [Micromonospora yangpuensis]